MLWRKLIPHWCSIQVGLIAALLPLGVRAEAPLPAAMPEDLLPQLKQLLNSAVNQSPSMLMANLDVASAEANRYGDAAGLWPSLGGSGRYAYTETAISSNTSSKSKTDGFQYNLYLNQPVFHFGALKAQADIGKIRVRIAERSYAEAYRSLASTIRTSYLTLIQKKISLRNTRVNVKAAENYLSVMEARRADGRVSEGDVQGPRLSVQEAHIAEEKTQEDYDYSRRVLSRLAGVPEIADENVPLEIPKPTFAAETIGAYFEEMKRNGVENPLSIQNFQDIITQNKLSYKIAKVRLYPKFGLSASIDQSNLTTVNGGVPTLTAVTTTNYGFGGSWTIFDGFATRGAKLSALAAIRVAEQKLKAFKEASSESARSLEKQIGFAGRLMDLTETRAALADAAVRKVQTDVESGVAPQTTLDATMQVANSAQLAAQGTRAEFLSRWADYVSLLGADPVLNNLPPRYLRNGK